MRRMPVLPATLAAAMLLGLPTSGLADFGATGILGPAGASVRTCDGVPSCVVRGPTEAWEAAIETAAPGSTVLLRGGAYAATTSLVVPAGTPTALITVANYNGEVPVLPRTLIPRSHTRFEGLAVEAFSNSFAIDVTSTTSTRVEDVVFKNLRVRGATSDAIRIKGNVHDVTLESSDVDGGRDHHAILSDCDADSPPCAFTVEDILVRNNHVSKSISYPSAAGEDVIQVEGAGTFTIERNTFENNPNGEECVDTKQTGRDGGSLVVRGNIIDGNCGGLLFIQRRAAGADLIESNLLRGGGSLIRGTATGSEIRNNVLLGADLTVASPDFRAVLGHNTWTGLGNRLTFGDSTGQPGAIETVNNIFDQTFFAGGSGPHNAVGNLLNGTSGGTLGTCVSCVTGNPLLADVYKLEVGSPAIDAASATYNAPTDVDGTPRPQGFRADIGAFEFVGTPQPPTASLTADPATIDPGASSTLTWGSTNAEGCVGTSFDTGGAVSGQQVVTPAATTTYSVDCDGAVANATVTVQEPPEEDVVAPVVDILSPAQGQVVRRTKTYDVTVEAFDDASGVATVQLTIEGTVRVTWTGAGTNTYRWRPGGLFNRTATIKAVATDNAGNSATDTITVLVRR